MPVPVAVPSALICDLLECCVQYASCTLHSTLLAIAVRGDGVAGARARGVDARREALAAARRGHLERAAHEQPARGAAAVRPGPRASCVALIRLLALGFQVTTTSIQLLYSARWLRIHTSTSVRVRVFYFCQLVIN